MSNEPYAMVRGRVVRVTALASCGSVPDNPVRYAVANCVAKVSVNEIIEDGTNEVLRDDEEFPVLHFVRETEVLGHTVDIDFLKTDPEMLELVSGNPLVYGEEGGEGFGEISFGEDPFGGGGTIIGFEQWLRQRATTAFALEIWSYLAGQVCAPGERKWGYTIFPYLKGGHLTGFEFANASVNFKLRGTQSRWGSKWNLGPHQLIPDFGQPALVSPRMSWRNFVYIGTPPEATDGIQTFTDEVLGGSASATSSDSLDGGSASSTTSDFVEGGAA